MRCRRVGTHTTTQHNTTRDASSGASFVTDAFLYGVETTTTRHLGRGVGTGEGGIPLYTGVTRCEVTAHHVHNHWRKLVANETNPSQRDETASFSYK